MKVVNHQLADVNDRLTCINGQLTDVSGKLTYELGETEITVAFNLISHFSDKHVAVSSKVQTEGPLSKINVTITPKEEIVIKSLFLEMPVQHDAEDTLFLNGFQSWTESRRYTTHEKTHKLSNLIWPTHKSYGDYTIHKNMGKNGVLFGFNYSYIKHATGQCDFFGSLSEDNGYTLFEYLTYAGLLHIKKDCPGHRIQKKYEAFNLLLCSGTEKTVFDHYFEKMRLTVSHAKPAIAWSNKYSKAAGNVEDQVTFQLQQLSERKIPLDMFLIEDGYAAAVGDWLATEKACPSGMKAITDMIRQKGYKSGLWLAPFICEKDSELFNTHHEWLQRDTRNRLIKAGVEEDNHREFYTLDLYNQAFREYLKQVFDTVFNTWDFDLVKLDYLYAVALMPRADKTRGQVMQDAIAFLDELTGKHITIGSGVPMGSAFGHFDYCGICSGISQKWEEERFKRLYFRERPSNINGLLNCIERRQLNGNAFHSDGDGVIIHQGSTKLTSHQKATQLLVKSIFTSLISTSDEMNAYTEEESRQFMALFPFKEKKAVQVFNDSDLLRIEFAIADQDYIAYVNLEDKELEYRLPEGVYYEGSKGFAAAGEKRQLHPYMSSCFLKIKAEAYALAGSTGHLFPASEVSGFNVKEDEIKLKLDSKFINKGQLYIRIPDEKEGCKVNGKYYKAEKIENLNLVTLELK